MIPEAMLYRASQHERQNPPRGSLAVALTVFPGEISKAGEQVYANLVYFNDVDGGACFADWKARAVREGARHGFGSRRYRQTIVFTTVTTPKEVSRE